MENASKALLIAGSVLLGIIVLSLFMIMVNSLTDYQQSQITNQREAEVIAFNNQFTGYMRDDVSGTDMLSLINKVVFYNRTKSSAGTGTLDTGEEFGYEPIELYINMNGNEKALAFDGQNNKVFLGNLEFKATKQLKQTNTVGFDALDKLLNNTQIPEPPTSASGETLPSEYVSRTLNLNYTEGILKGLLENSNSSDSIFGDDFLNYDEKKKRKCFSEFNLILGKIYFPLRNITGNAISINTLDNWWRQYFHPNYSSKKDGNGKTIREELAYYYEYTQFQRGKFRYVPPTGTEKTYSPNTNRVIFMKFEFTGDFV